VIGQDNGFILNNRKSREKALLWTTPRRYGGERHMNPEHFARLKEEDTRAWNFWRAQNPDIRPDLSQADLTRKFLPGINFSNTDLSGASLCGTYLVEADLRAANLASANLGHLTLWRQTTDLETGKNAGNLHFTEHGPNFTSADLTHASLIHARLVLLGHKKNILM
jgi:uncharacterized protein YjbI with pentapeptide repeats